MPELDSLNFSGWTKALNFLSRKKSLKNDADAMQQAFYQQFEKEMLDSEKLRLTALTAVATVTLLSFIVFYFFFYFQYKNIFDEQLPIVGLVIFFSIIIIYGLHFRNQLVQDIQLGRKYRVWLRYWTAFIETSIPTVGMILLAQTYDPAPLLFTPIPFLYFYFILLSCLRLDFKLSVFTGTVASVEYIALFYYFINHRNTFSIEPDFLDPFDHLQKGLIFLLAGIITGVITIQIQKRIFISLRSLEDKNQIIRVFGQHVSPVVVNRILDQKKDLVSEIRYVCIMFLDIRGFTKFSESKKPEEVVYYLNTLFSFMIDIVNHNHGIINKFLGDGFMAVFGAPLSNGNDCQDAVTAALEIIERIEREIAAGNIPPTRIGIGLHSGNAVTGTVGSILRQEYTVIGDVVNLACRIEQLNKQFTSQVLISEAVWDAVGRNIKNVSEIGKVQVKGRQTPVQIYQLV